MIVLDTNLLIYAHREASPEHEQAREAIGSAVNDSRGWGICLPTVTEFWSIVTHPKIPGGPSSPTVVAHFFHYLLTEGRGSIWSPGPGFGERLMRWATSLRVRGKRIFDLQIAVIAHEHGANEIWTHDKAFVSIPAVKVSDPLA
jgi:predicted nucleic acid-binding protein